MENKVCSKCKQSKPKSEFTKDKSRRDGLIVWCKQCRLEYQRLPREVDRRRKYSKKYYAEHKEQCANYRNHFRYGLTTKERENLLDSVGRRCEACGIKEEYLTKGLFIHHNHQTNKVEGVLCSNFNFAIGLLGNDSTRIRALLSFLEQINRKENKDE